MSFGVWITDKKLFDLEKKLDMFLQDDDVDYFLKTVDLLDGTCSTLVRGQEFLMKACHYRAIKCASALLNGLTPYIFDVNRPTHAGKFLIHDAAWHCDAAMIELLLHHGARADVRSVLICDDKTPYLPLHGVLHQLRNCYEDYDLNPRASIHQLVTFICLQDCQVPLECVELLAWKTDSIDNEFIRYTREENLLFLAALLAVARKRLVNPISTVQDYLSSHRGDLKMSKSGKEKLNLLLEVFEKAGDQLEDYIKEDKNGVAVEKICRKVATLLKAKGFHVDPLRAVLSRLKRPAYSSDDSDEESLDPMKEDKDFGMEHYGKTGHRWMIYNKPMKTLLNAPNKTVRKYEITEEQRRLIRTAVGKRMPIPIPCNTYYGDCTAAEFIKQHAPEKEWHKIFHQREGPAPVRRVDKIAKIAPGCKAIRGRRRGQRGAESTSRFGF